jgi:glycosyltransferase involved in cell wall biosynthesis
VSVFTAAFESGDAIDRAYSSLLRQTYPGWEWVVVDDSEGTDTATRIARMAESSAARGRIRLYRQLPSTGSIGATKAAAAALSRGEFVVELDHDDELRPEALDVVVAGFSSRPDVDFLYSDLVEVLDGEPTAGYPAGWGLGFGAHASEVIDGRRVPVTLSPPITWETVRHIVAMPNHLRAWRREFYGRIGGHDPRLPVADDYELLVRTFLYGTMARIPRPLYVQHHRADGATASRRRNADIQRLVAQESERHQDALDRRCRSLGLHPWHAAIPPWAGSQPLHVANPVVDVMADAAAGLGIPLVSVVMPTYRRPALLERAIRSVLAQSHTNVEVLVVGDHCPSVDDVVARIADGRVRHWNLAARSNDGGTTPRNYALKAMARGTLAAYLDDDNVWRHDHLETLVRLFTTDSRLAFAFSSFEIGGDEIVCRRPRRFQIDTSALLHRRSLLERHGYWRPPADVGFAHDWELVSRWENEPWAASLQATVIYNLETSSQDAATVRHIRQVADEEAQAATRGLRVAVYTIVRDEEAQLEQWVASAREADVMVIADTGSSDSTVRRARELGVDVHEIRVEPFRYDTARNVALDLLPDDVDVCVSLDADEVILPGWRAELERAWEHGTTKALSWLEWSWSDAFPPLRYTAHRIHARHSHHWECPVHEELVARGDEAAVRTQIEIRHLREPSRPVAGNLELLRLGVSERPGDGRMAHMLANEARMNGHNDEAARLFRRALELPLSDHERLHSMLMLSHLEPGRRETWIAQACAASPGRREPWCALAQLHFEREQWVECRVAARTALRIDTPADDYLANVFAWGAWPDRLAAEASIELGDDTAAAHHARRAWQAAPWDHQLAELQRLIDERVSARPSSA